MSYNGKNATSIEDLFILGSFAEAYKLGEDEILQKLSERYLPRSLLLPRLLGRSLPPSSAQNTSRTSTSSTSAATKGDRGSNSGLSSSTHAPSPSHSVPSRNVAVLDFPLSASLDTTFSTMYGAKHAQSSGVASSSGNPLPSKPKELSYRHLSDSDQGKLRTLVTEAMPTLVIMVQCLFELGERSQIVPFLHALCGEQYEDYPFELSYLVINLFVTMEDYIQARVACEPVLSSLKSRLGPIPVKQRPRFLQSSNSDTLFDEAHTPSLNTPKAPTMSQQRESSGESTSDPSGSPQESFELSQSMLLDEDEATHALRGCFQSLMHLYIFYILCPLNLFADAKSYLFLEGRLHPMLLQEWICRVDECEGEYLEAQKRQEEEKRNLRASGGVGGIPAANASTMGNTTYSTTKTTPTATSTTTSMDFVSSISSPLSSLHSNRDATIGTSTTPKKPQSTVSWVWNTLFDDESDGDGVLGLHSSSSSSSATSSSFAKQGIQLSSSSSFTTRTLAKMLKIYRFLASRYQELSPPLQLALATLAAAALYVVYIFFSSKWYRNLSISKWIMERFQAVRSAFLTGGASASASSVPSSATAKRLIASTTSRFPSSTSPMFQNTVTNSRAVMGSGMVRSSWNH